MLPIEQKIKDFNLSIEYDRTSDPEYMRTLAKAALAWFGFPEADVDFKRLMNPPGLAYNCYLDGEFVDGFAVILPDDDNLGVNLGYLIERLIIEQLAKVDPKLAEYIADNIGGIRGLHWDFVGPKQ